MTGTGATVGRMLDWAMLEAMREVDEMTPDAPRLAPLEYSYIRTAAEFRLHAESLARDANNAVGLMLLAANQQAGSLARYEDYANQASTNRALDYVALAGRGS